MKKRIVVSPFPPRSLFASFILLLIIIIILLVFLIHVSFVVQYQIFSLEIATLYYTAIFLLL